MTKAEKNYYINKDYVAYYSGFSGLEIKEIQYGIETYIIFVAGAWCSKKKRSPFKGILYPGGAGLFQV